VLGVQKSDGIPDHKIPERTHERKNSNETRNLRKSVLVSKVVNPFTRALEPRETKGLLNFETTLESREYPQCEHVHKCLLHPVIYGTNFTHLQVCHQFTP
jgi:hypothetical protein